MLATQETARNGGTAAQSDGLLVLLPIIGRRGDGHCRHSPRESSYPAYPSITSSPRNMPGTGRRQPAAAPRVSPSAARLRERWDAGDEAGTLSELEGILSALRAARYALSANLYQERAGGLSRAWSLRDTSVGLEFRDGENFQVRSRWMEHLFAVPADAAGTPSMPSLSTRAPCCAAGSGRPPPAPGARRPGGRRAAAFGTPRGRPNLVPADTWPSIRDRLGRQALARAALGRSHRPLRRAGLTVTMTGAPEEKPLADSHPRVPAPEARARTVDLCGATSLLGSAWVHAQARLAITGDTVAMHLAAAAGTPVAGFVRTVQYRGDGPYGRRARRESRPKPTPPRSCLERPHPGLSRLAPAEVAAWVLRVNYPADFRYGNTAWDAETERADPGGPAAGCPNPACLRGAGLARVLERGRFSGRSPHPQRPRAAHAMPRGSAGSPGDPREALRLVLARRRRPPYRLDSRCRVPGPVARSGDRPQGGNRRHWSGRRIASPSTGSRLRDFAPICASAPPASAMAGARRKPPPPPRDGVGGHCRTCRRK
jgi:hypothetical protein